jgi:hypothetical protein
MKAQSRDRTVEVLLCPFLNLGARWGVGDNRHVPAALPQGKRDGTHFAGGWLGFGVGLNRCGKSRPHRPARSKSLYQLRYPAHHIRI